MASRSPRHRTGRTERGLLVLLALAPLGLGGVVLFTEALFALVAALLLAAGARCGHLPPTTSPPGRWVAATAGVGVVVLVWASAQTAPLGALGFQTPRALPGYAGLLPPMPDTIALAPGLAGTAAMVAGTMIAVFAVASGLGRSHRTAERILVTVALAGGVYAAYGVANLAVDSPHVLWMSNPYASDWATGPFINRNNFATFCGLALLAAVGPLVDRFAARGRGRRGLTRALAVLDELDWGDWALVLACVLLVVALLLSGSRGGSTATGIGLLVLLLARGAGHRGGRVRLIAAVLVAAFGAAALAFGGRLGLRLVGTLETGVGNRAEIYALAVRALSDRPMTGFGLGGFADVFDAYRGQAFVATARIAQEVHNDYLELAIELGGPAAALVVATLIALSLRCLRGAVIRRRHRVYPAVAAGASALVGTHALVDFSLQIPAIALTYAALLGVGLGQAFPSGTRRTRRPAQTTGESRGGPAAGERVVGEVGEHEAA